MVDEFDDLEREVNLPKINTHRVEGEHGVSILLGCAPETQGITTDPVSVEKAEKSKRGRPPKQETD